MGLGLTIAARLAKGRPAEALAALRAAVEASAGEAVRWTSTGDDDGPPWLAIALQPAEEALTFTFEPERIVATARTSGAGPGYHAFVCELLRGAGDELGIDWTASRDDEGDETGFFDCGDRVRLEREFHAFVAALARQLDSTGGPLFVGLGPE